MTVCGLSDWGFGGALNGLGMCSSGVGRLLYEAGFGVMWFRYGYRVLAEYVILYWVDVFPSPVVFCALELNVVAFQGGGSVNYGARDLSGLFCCQ